MKDPDPFEQKLIDLFTEHGVGDWLFAYRDPDANETVIRKISDDHWCYGVGERFKRLAMKDDDKFDVEDYE